MSGYKEEAYELLAEKRKALIENRASLEAKLLSNEDHLADFVMPKREKIQRDEERSFGDLVNLKELLNSISDNELRDDWYLNTDYDGCPTGIARTYESDETDEEYNHRVGILQRKYIQDSKTRREKVLRENLKGLTKNITKLEKAMGMIKAPATPEEELQAILLEFPEEKRAEMERNLRLLTYKLYRCHG